MLRNQPKTMSGAGKRAMCQVQENIAQLAPHARKHAPDAKRGKKRNRWHAQENRQTVISARNVAISYVWNFVAETTIWFFTFTAFELFRLPFLIRSLEDLKTATETLFTQHFSLNLLVFLQKHKTEILFYKFTHLTLYRKAGEMKGCLPQNHCNIISQWTEIAQQDVRHLELFEK